MQRLTATPFPARSSTALAQPVRRAAQPAVQFGAIAKDDFFTTMEAMRAEEARQSAERESKPAAETSSLRKSESEAREYIDEIFDHNPHMRNAFLALHFSRAQKHYGASI